MVLQLGLIYGIVALGVFFTFRALNFADMTVDGSFIVGGCVASVAVGRGFCPITAILFACAAAASVGLFTAHLHVKFQIGDLLAGIVVASMCYSLGLRIMGGAPNVVFKSPESCRAMLPLFCLCVAAAAAYILCTDFGLAFRCVGLNRRLAKSQNISAGAMIYFGVAFGNCCAGAAGAFFCLTHGFCDIGSGVGTLIGGLAALIIGETLFPFHSAAGKITACFLGSIAYRAAVAFALHSDLPFLRASDFNMITGLLVVLFLATKRKQCHADS
jgi:putative ABC transport system permease protein